MIKLCRTCLFETNNEKKYTVVSDNMKCGEEMLEISQMIFICAGLEVCTLMNFVNTFD